jgi:hypothetical protein
LSTKSLRLLQELKRIIEKSGSRRSFFINLFAV